MPDNVTAAVARFKQATRTEQAHVFALLFALAGETAQDIVTRFLMAL